MENRNRQNFKRYGGGNRKTVRNQGFMLENNRPQSTFESDMFDDDVKYYSGGSFDIMSRETDERRTTLLPTLPSSHMRDCGDTRKRAENNIWSKRNTDRSRQRNRAGEYEGKCRKRNRSDSSSYGRLKRRMIKTDTGFHCHRTRETHFRNQLEDVSGGRYRQKVNDRNSQIDGRLSSGRYSLEDGEIDEFQRSPSYDMERSPSCYSRRSSSYDSERSLCHDSKRSPSYVSEGSPSYYSENEYSPQNPIMGHNLNHRPPRSHISRRDTFEDREINDLRGSPYFDRNIEEERLPGNSLKKRTVHGRHSREYSLIHRRNGNKKRQDEFGPKGHHRGFFNDENGQERNGVRDRLCSQRLHDSKSRMSDLRSRRKDTISEQNQNDITSQHYSHDTDNRTFRNPPKTFHNGEQLDFHVGQIKKEPFSPLHCSVGNAGLQPFQKDESSRNLSTKYQSVDKYCEDIDQRINRGGNAHMRQREQNISPMKYSTYLDNGISFEKQLQDPYLKQEIAAEVMGCMVQKSLRERTGFTIDMLLAYTTNSARTPFKSLQQLRSFLSQNRNCFEVINSAGTQLVKARTDITLCQQYVKGDTIGMVSCGETCHRLHICKFYLFGTCSKPYCERDHDLFNAHNIRVLRDHCLHRISSDNIKLLISRPENRNMTTLPIICKFYNNEGNCNKRDKCPQLHVCKYYIDGTCKFEGNCRRNHCFNSPLTIPILQRYGIPPSLQREQYRLLMKKSIQSTPNSTTQTATRYFKTAFIKRSTVELKKTDESFEKLVNEKLIPKAIRKNKTNTIHNTNETVLNKKSKICLEMDSKIPVCQEGSNNESVSDSGSKLESVKTNKALSSPSNAREISSADHIQEGDKRSSLKTSFSGINPTDLSIKQEKQEIEMNETTVSFQPFDMQFSHVTFPKNDLDDGTIVKQEDLDNNEINESYNDKKKNLPDSPGNPTQLLTTPEGLDAIQNLPFENVDDLKNDINTTDSEIETHPFKMVGPDAEVVVSANHYSTDTHITRKILHSNDEENDMTVNNESKETHISNVSSKNGTDIIPNGVREMALLYSNGEVNECQTHETLSPMETTSSKSECGGLNKTTNPTDAQLENTPCFLVFSDKSSTVSTNDCSGIRVTSQENLDSLEHLEINNEKLQTKSNGLRVSKVMISCEGEINIKQNDPSSQYENKINVNVHCNLPSATSPIGEKKESCTQMNESDDNASDFQNECPETMLIAQGEVTSNRGSKDENVQMESQEANENSDICKDIKDSVAYDTKQTKLLHEEGDANIILDEDMNTDTYGVRSTDPGEEVQTIPIESMKTTETTEPQTNDKSENVKESLVSSSLLGELKTTQVNSIQFTHKEAKHSFLCIDGKWRLEQQTNTTPEVDSSVNKSIQQAYTMLIGVAERTRFTNQEKEMENISC